MTAAPARCRCAPATTVSTSRRSRGSRAGRAPAGGGLLDLARAGRVGRVPARGSRAAAVGEVTADPVSDGIVLYDKPAGITSHDVVARMRRALGARGGRSGRVKVGHAGTLDPFATGLLLILVGRATRVQRFLMALSKRYEATARFGAVSTTGDPEGEITATGVVPSGDLDLPTGSVRQRPPAYSAVKVGGRRAYALARAGEQVELAERVVEVYRFDERWRDGDRRGFVIECSSGTYVRSLIADLGDAYCERASADGDRPVRGGAMPIPSGSSGSTTRCRSCPRSGSIPRPPGAPGTEARSRATRLGPRWSGSPTIAG